jgi:hypothetical protein
MYTCFLHVSEVQGSTTELYEVIMLLITGNNGYAYNKHKDVRLEENWIRAF